MKRPSVSRQSRSMGRSSSTLSLCPCKDSSSVPRLSYLTAHSPCHFHCRMALCNQRTHCTNSMFLKSLSLAFIKHERALHRLALKFCYVTSTVIRASWVLSNFILRRTLSHMTRNSENCDFWVTQGIQGVWSKSLCWLSLFRSQDH